MGVHAPDEPARQHQISESEQREQLRVVLGQSAVARLAMLEQALHYMEAMLDLRAHAGLRLLQLFLGSAQRILLEHLAHAWPHCRMPVDRLARVLGALGHALVASVAQHSLLAAVQQRVRLRHVGYVAGGADDGMNQAGRHVHAHVCLHAKVPVVAFLRLMHLRIAFLVAVLGRRWRCDQGGVHDGPFTHRQALAGKVAFDFIEDAARQRILFQQTAELEQRRRVRRRFVREVDTDKGAHRLDVVDRVLDPFVRQPKALLSDVHAQHALQANRRATATIAFGIVRQQRCHQGRPRRRRVDLGQETLAPRQLFLAGELDVGKARLLHHVGVRMRYAIVPAQLAAGETSPIKSVLP